MAARLVVYALVTDTATYLLYDRTMALVHRNTGKQPLVGLVLLPFIFLFFAFHHFQAENAHPSVAIIAVELMVINPSNSIIQRQANGMLFNVFLKLLSFLHKYRSKWNFGNNLHNWHTESTHKVRTLVHYRSFSLLTRVKIATFELYTEAYICAFFTLLIILLLLSGITYCFTLWSARNSPGSESKIGIIMIVTDALFIFAQLHYTLNGAFMAAKTIGLAIYAWKRHLGELTKEATANQGTSRLVISSVSFISTHFISRHSLVLLDLIALNRHIASSLLFAFYLPNLIANVYVISALYFLSHSWWVRRSLQLVLCAHLNVFLALVIFPAIQQALYYADRALYRACAHLKVMGEEGGKSRYLFPLLRQKLKLSAYYELLATENPFVFHLGSYAMLTRQWLFEVSCFNFCSVKNKVYV